VKLASLTLSALSALLLVGVAAAPARADDPLASEVPVTIGGNNYFNVSLTSFKMGKFKSIYLQKYDYSCGSAALASLLTYHYKRPTREDDVFQRMFAVGDQAQIRREGFSLLDMKKYLGSIGLHSDGFEVSLDKLAEIKLPAITLIETNGYKHFVIIKGVEGGRVLIGDPAKGTYAQDRSIFESRWDKVAFLIRDDVEVAQASFNQEKDWAVQGRAPIGAAFRQNNITNMTIHLPAPLF
jgi:uncharacterized protein